MIVESPAKAKTIEKYLGKGWRVIASVGHVRDLVPENGSIDVANDFAPKWQIMPGKEKVIKQIVDEVKKADEVYLASDPDREGEAISWHILSILNEKKALAGKKVFRVAFHEITKTAVMEQLKHPREIDQNLVDAYLVRRALDYLIGFNLSPVLWKKSVGKSAGRVQSVAVWLVVAREKEIEAFRAQEYWSIDALCGFAAHLSKFGAKKIEKMTIGSKAEADEILAALKPHKTIEVISVEKKQTTRRPFAPFTTSTLQQESARKLHFSSKRTMSAAQHLYEQGFITYMRTDSTNLSADALAEMRDFIGSEYGAKYLPAAPNVYAKKQKNAQEAHEAVRPTHFGPAPALDGDEAKLYDLIWKRTLACQMTNALFDAVAVDFAADKTAQFHATGQTLIFDGFLKAYDESTDEETDKENDAALPPLAVGDIVPVEKYQSDQHFTQPPPRFTEASLVKKMEELGIGRPSTYASIMSTIVDRQYVDVDRGRRFTPTPAGWLVSTFLTDYFNQLIQVDFTAKTEDALDDVSNGTADRSKVLKGFWSPFADWAAAAAAVPIKDVWDKMSADLAPHFLAGGTKCPDCGGELGIRQGRFGAFISCKNYPDCKYIKNLASSESKDQSDLSPDLGEGISFKTGRFGPYVSDGTKNASAKKYTRETITLEIAKELLAAVGQKSEPIKLGKNPKTDAEILFYPTGRFGPYISSNKVNVSVKEQPDLDAAADLINNKKPSAFKRKWNK
jgi:DNA topoisomerase-1